MSVYSRMQDPIWKGSAQERKPDSLGNYGRRPRKKKPRNKLTPEQISQLTHRKQELKEQDHLHCRMEVRQRGPHTGLYCSEHGTWIRWISATEANKIKDIL